MPRKLWDKTFSAIGERNELSAGFAQSKIAESEALRAAIVKEHGEEAARNLFSSEIIEALRQCVAAQAPGSNVSNALYYIYFEHAANAAKAIDQQLDNFYADLKW